MPKLITMVALVAFDRNGKNLKAGDEFQVLPIEAASLKFNKKASFTTVKPSKTQVLGTRTMTAAPRSRPAVPSGTPAAGQQQVSESPEQADGGKGRRTGGRGSGRGGDYPTRDMAASSEGDKG